jgi:hypothetical protein
MVVYMIFEEATIQSRSLSVIEKRRYQARNYGSHFIVKIDGLGLVTV